VLHRPPTFALRQGQVYQATPYVSPDIREWVAATLSHQFDIAVVDARTGQVVIDSRRPQQVGAPLDDPDDHRFRPIVATGASRGRHSVDDHPAAYQRLQRLPGNANDWYVVAAELVWPSDRPAVADQLDPVHDRG
jgi:hypothetical protein